MPKRRCPPPLPLPSWERLGTLEEGAHSPLPGGLPGPHPLRLPAPCPRPCLPLPLMPGSPLGVCRPSLALPGLPPFSALRDPIHPSRPSQTVTFPGAFSVPLLLGRRLFPLFPWLASMHWLISSVFPMPATSQASLGASGDKRAVALPLWAGFLRWGGRVPRSGSALHTLVIDPWRRKKLGGQTEWAFPQGPPGSLSWGRQWGRLAEDLLDGGFEEQQGPESEERGLHAGRGVQVARGPLVRLAGMWPLSPVWGWPRSCCAAQRWPRPSCFSKAVPGGCLPGSVCVSPKSWWAGSVSVALHSGDSASTWRRYPSGAGGLTLPVGARCTRRSLGLLSPSAPPRGRLPSPGAPVCWAVLRHRSPTAHPGRLWPLFCVAWRVWWACGGAGEPREWAPRWASPPVR